MLDRSIEFIVHDKITVVKVLIPVCTSSKSERTKWFRNVQCFLTWHCIVLILLGVNDFSLQQGHWMDCSSVGSSVSAAHPA